MRRDERHDEVLLTPEEMAMDAVLHLQALVLNFQKKIPFAKNIGIRSRGGTRSFVLLFHQRFRHFALQAARKRNQPLGMLREKFLTDPGFVVEAVERSLRSNLH